MNDRFPTTSYYVGLACVCSPALRSTMQTMSSTPEHRAKARRNARLGNVLWWCAVVLSLAALLGLHTLVNG